METYLNFFMLPGGQSDTNLFPDVDSSWKVCKVFFATHFFYLYLQVISIAMPVLLLHYDGFIFFVYVGS